MLRLFEKKRYLDDLRKRGPKKATAEEFSEDNLLGQIGKLKVELDWLKKKL